ncbi:MAG: ATP-binding protein [Planctomycetota bacterium]
MAYSFLYELLAPKANYEKLRDGKLLQLAEVPRRYWWDNVQNHEGLPHYDPIKRYIDSLPAHNRRGRGLLLYGALGTGKTSLACRVLMDAMARAPIPAHFQSALELDECSKHRQEESASGYPIWDLICGAQFLVLDDFGTVRTAYHGRLLEEVIRRRYNNRLVTTITTNLQLAEIEARYPWFVSIAKQTLEIIEVSGKDWREPPDDAVTRLGSLL